MDLYFDTTIVGRRMITKWLEATDASADVDQEFWIPVNLPLTFDRIIIKCMDHDTIGYD